MSKLEFNHRAVDSIDKSISSLLSNDNNTETSYRLFPTWWDPELPAVGAQLPSFNSHRYILEFGNYNYSIY